MLTLLELLINQTQSYFNYRIPMFSFDLYLAATTDKYILNVGNEHSCGHRLLERDDNRQWQLKS